MEGRQRAAHAVAARRGKLKLSQKALALRAGIDTKTIGNLERRGKWPIATTRSAIEEALGWPDGEMERIAALPGDQPESEPEPLVDPLLADALRKYAPEDADRIIAELERVRAARLEGPSEQAAC